MKKILFLSIFALMFAFSINAYSADQGWYVSGNAGIIKIDDSDFRALWINDLTYDTGYILGVAVGYDFGNWRCESELAYQDSDMDVTIVPPPGVDSGTVYTGSGEISSFSLLFNGYYDFLQGNKLRPYITGGIGLANVQIEIRAWPFGFKEGTAVFACQIGAGLGYDMSKNVTLDLKYRYLRTSDPEYDGAKTNYSGNSVVLGLRYYF